MNGTKKELQAEIERLNSVIEEQRKAVRKLSEDYGCEINLPHAATGMNVPLIMDGREHNCRDEICKVVFDSISEHGIPDKRQVGAFTNRRVSFRDWHGGNSFVVPTIAAKIIAALLNNIAAYGEEMYRSGRCDGANHLVQLTKHLVQLAKGEVGLSKYESEEERIQLRNRSRTSRLRIEGMETKKL